MGSISQSIPFGRPMLDHFLFDKEFKELNHGAYGTYPKPVQTALRHFQDLAEAAPNKFMRFQYEGYLLAARTAIAKLLNASPDTCVFVQNATLGINTVLRNLIYEPGDVIVYFDTIYDACEKTIFSVMETTPHVQARKVEGYAFPCEHEEIVQKFLEEVERLKGEGLRAKVAVFDTICSLPGVRCPFERLTEECRRLGILSCIDAAHGVGQIPLDLGKLDPDFFVSNCHKWLFAPRGCAIFHVPPRNQHLIRTTIPTSHGFVPLSLQNPTNPTNPIQNPGPPPHPNSQVTPFTTLFSFVGTADNSPYYCVPAALAFREKVCGGEDSVTEYLRASMRRGGDLVANSLGTEVMQDQAGKLRECAFANVRLPIVVSGAKSDLDRDMESRGKGDREVAIREEEMGTVVDYIKRTLVQDYNTFIQVYGYKGRVWARLSGQVYLDEQDWEWCGEVLGQVLKLVREGRYKEEKQITEKIERAECLE